MIPTMIVVGLVVGPVGLERRSRPYALLVAAVLCLAWGVLVTTLADGDVVATFVGGTWLAVANVIAGAAVAIALTLVLRSVRRSAFRV